MRASPLRSAVVALSLAVAACATSTPEPVTESRFLTTLSAEYEALAESEAGEADWRDARRFAERARRTAAGETVPPEPLANRDLRDADALVLGAAREELVVLLEGGAPVLAARDAAIGQAAFDCWIQEQEEGFQLADIAACKSTLQAALAAMTDALASTAVILLPDRDGSLGRIALVNPRGTVDLDQPRQLALSDEGGAPTVADRLAEEEVEALVGDALAVQPEPPVSYTLFFETGTDTLTPASRALLPEALEEISGRTAARATVFGHTDTVGSAAVNVRLSLQRAEAVVEELLAIGFLRDQVDFEAFGESRLAVQTPDDTPEPRNRRAELLVR